MSRGRAGLALVSAAIIAGVSSLLSGAQTPALGRWPPHSKILVWIDPASPSGVAEYVERAIKVWSEAAEGRFTLQRTPSLQAATVRVRFSTPDGVYGQTMPHRDPRTGFLADADVAIVIPRKTDTLNDRIVTYLTALHELGHAVGLGHTDDFSDIMYSFRRPDDGERYFAAYRSRLGSARDIGTPRATGLSAGDIETLRALYGG